MCGGGFDVAEVLNRSPSDKRKIIRDIYDFIRANDITEFYQLTDYAFDNDPDWFDVLCDGHTIMFNAVIQSRRHAPQLRGSDD